MRQKILYIGVCRDNLQAHHPTFPPGIFLDGPFSDEELLATIAAHEIEVLMVDVLPRPFSRELLLRMNGRVRMINFSYQSIESLIDVGFAEHLGVEVRKLPAGLYSEEVAEFAVGLLLVTCKEFIRYDSDLKEGIWNQAAATGISLRGKTLGVLGYGSIGKQIVLRCENWGMKLLVCRRNPHRKPSNPRVTLVDLVTLVRESDFIILALPGSPENFHLVNEEILQLCKHQAILINVARGDIVDEAAICRALAAGRLRRYCSDVFTREPLAADHGLVLAKQQTILSPHVAWATAETLKKTYTIWFDQIDTLTSRV